MPSDDRLWLHEDQCLLPTRPDTPQDHPEQLIWSFEPRLRMSLPQDRKLLPQRQVFKKQVVARAHTASQNSEEKSQRSEHEAVVSGGAVCKFRT